MSSFVAELHRPWDHYDIRVDQNSLNLKTCFKLLICCDQCLSWTLMGKGHFSWKSPFLAPLLFRKGHSKGPLKNWRGIWPDGPHFHNHWMVGIKSIVILQMHFQFWIQWVKSLILIPSTKFLRQKNCNLKWHPHNYQIICGTPKTTKIPSIT